MHYTYLHSEREGKMKKSERKRERFTISKYLLEYKRMLYACIHQFIIGFKILRSTDASFIS